MVLRSLSSASALSLASQQPTRCSSWYCRSLPPLLLESDGESFYRGNDLLRTGPRVTERQIVNVLGRWATHEEWDSIGVAAAFDDFSSGDFYEDDVPSLMTDFGASNYHARRPSRREFCQRHGLVQRWIHAENVGLLPFTCDALAASVRSDAASMDAEPIDPLAAEIVFDALSGSQSGIVTTAQCDERRASYVRADGSFDAHAFSSDLVYARRNIVVAYAVYPGLLIATALITAIKMDAFHLVLEWLSRSTGSLSRAWDKSGAATLLLPSLMALVLLRNPIKPLEGSEREKAHLRKKDQAYLKKMRERRAGR
jgi:hypothetical protein